MTDGRERRGGVCDPSVKDLLVPETEKLTTKKVCTRCRTVYPRRTLDKRLTSFDNRLSSRLSRRPRPGTGWSGGALEDAVERTERQPLNVVNPSRRYS